MPGLKSTIRESADRKPPASDFQKLWRAASEFWHLLLELCSAPALPRQRAQWWPGVRLRCKRSLCSKGAGALTGDLPACRRKESSREEGSLRAQGAARRAAVGLEKATLARIPRRCDFFAV